MGVEGVWFNELGSSMKLVLEGGAITGTYATGVGEADGQFPLYGATDSSPSTNGQAIGFVVAWINNSGNANSVTAWSGQYQKLEGQEVLTTMWLLTDETPSSEDWASILVGKDVFIRQAAPLEVSAQRLKVTRPSHPTRR